MTSRTYTHAGFFALRATLFPFDALREWSAQSADNAPRFLKQMLRDPHFAEAITLASPNLFARLAEEKEGDGVGSEFLIAVSRYFARACSRATPFGLFAGVTCGEIAAKTELRLNCRKDWIRHARLDHDALAQIGKLAEQVLRRHPSLKLWTNSSLYVIGERARYYERAPEGSAEFYRLVEVDAPADLQRLLTAARKGIARESAAQHLAHLGTSDEVAEFIDLLVDAQVLVADTEPVLTGSTLISPGDGLLPDAVPLRGQIEELRHAVAEIDGLELGRNADYPAVRESLERALPGQRPERMIQVDLELSAQACRIEESVVREVAAAVELSYGLGVRPSQALRDIATRFNDRWGDAWVPLAVAFDEESGLGFNRFMSSAPAIVKQLDIKRQIARPTSVAPDGSGHRLLTEKILQALAAGESEVVLTRKDVDDARAAATGVNRPEYAYAITSMYTQPNTDAIERVVLSVFGGPSAGMCIGRFCDTSDALRSNLQRLHDEEQQADPDTIYAEIVHVPEARLGNVIARPVLRRHEIGYLGKSGCDAEDVLRVDDLQVAVRNGRFVLWSTKHNRRVIPRMSSAHNHNSPKCLGIYQFLCLLQTDGYAYPQPIVPEHLASAPFVPRVRFGRCVLSLARWTIRRDELAALKKATTPDAARALREIRKMPRFVRYGSGDNLMVVDWENAQSIASFLEGQSGSVQVQEMSPGPYEPAVTGPGGAFEHEVIFPLRLTQPVASRATQLHPTAPVRHLPGGDWLMLKIYAGPMTCDHVLSGLLPGWVEKHQREQPGAPWFFMRYADPETHARVRFKGRPEWLYGHLLPAINASLASLSNSEAVSRVVVDTYLPECNRYGGPAVMGLIERCFAADSEAVLHWLSKQSGDDHARLVYAVTGVEHLLRRSPLSQARQLELLSDLSLSMVQGYGGSRTLKSQLGDAFRKLRSDVEAAIRQPGPELVARSAIIGDLLGEVVGDATGEGLTASIESITADLAHMFLNRVFVSYSREQEMIAYDVLRRLHVGTAARERAAPVPA